MKTLLFLFMGVVAVLPMNILAQNVKRPESYNYMRGLEAMQGDKVQEALDYFNKDLEENPKNGYSFSWIALLRFQQEEFGRALTAVDLAVKYLPKKDADYLSFALATRGDVYLHLNDTTKALKDYCEAIKISPNKEGLYDKRAQVYFEQGRYDLSDADYKKMVELKPGEVMGYMGLGRNLNNQERWEEAIKQFNQVIKLESDYSSGYAFRAAAYIGLKKWNEATDDLVHALVCDYDLKALYHLAQLQEPALGMAIAKMKVQAAKSPNEKVWPYYIATTYDRHQDYLKAIEFYAKANQIDASADIHERMARCYYHAGRYREALEQIDQALNMDNTDLSYTALRANILYESGEIEPAIAEWDKVLEQQPDYAFGYYRRGWFKELAGKPDDAIEDLTMCVTLDPTFAYAYQSRGDIYKDRGQKELAEADYRRVIELENTPEKYECVQYAYLGIGNKVKAKEVMDCIIAADTANAGNYYDAACLYARMGETERALDFLRQSFEHGYKRFAHIMQDNDMESLRETASFKALIEKFDTESGDRQQGSTSAAQTEETVEIPFIKSSGVCQVKCNINDLPLYFIFDTGASTVSLSMVEATFMMKNGFLTSKDVVGNQRFEDANGNINEGTVINLRSVNFGGLELTNVRASVVRNQKAPLLLGQSVLGRLGKIEIDNGRKVLKITHNN